MAHTHHAIEYFEITVSDIPAARDFYGRAFGWEFNGYGPEYAGIKRLDGGDGEMGGLGLGTHLQPGPGGSLILLYSRDLEATLEAIKAAGGTIAVDPYDYPGGRRFFFSDVSGNTLGVFKSDDTD
jgi:predicted enzyme related to lactoylglutathione lyase